MQFSTLRGGSGGGGGGGCERGIIKEQLIIITNKATQATAYNTNKHLPIFITNPPKILKTLKKLKGLNRNLKRFTTGTETLKRS